MPPNDLTEQGYTEVETPNSLGLRIGNRPVASTVFVRAVSDVVSPNYDQITGSLAAYGGKVPLVSKGVWIEALPDDIDPQLIFNALSVITYENMRYMADVMVPRAVGYSTGMIDFFFRGRLELTPVEQGVLAVLNQGEPHVMVGVLPRKSATTNQTFGYEAIRIKVRNATPNIVESGTNQVVPQVTGGPDTRLVAIAKYRLNECYRPDLSGERAKDFGGTLTPGNCSPSLLRSRGLYSYVSVSAPLSVVAGELDGVQGVEKLFDFSADPIPVNATDLFIQIAYRGRLGDEHDGIAVGIYDSSEPTFVSFWNNTDYFWTGTQYLQENATVPKRSVRTFYACAGFPSKLMYRYAGESTSSAMLLPPPANQVRLAMIFAKPSSPTQQFPVRAVPIMLTPPHAALRSSFTRGQIRQANREEVSDATVAAPYEGCASSLPQVAEYWCSDPIKIRRGIRFGEVAQPIYYSTQGAGDGPDVDSVPLPAFASTVVRDGGEIRFNQVGALENCPPQALVESGDFAGPSSDQLN